MWPKQRSKCFGGDDENAVLNDMTGAENIEAAKGAKDAVASYGGVKIKRIKVDCIPRPYRKRWALKSLSALSDN
jgi:hypothetical protein